MYKTNSVSNNFLFLILKLSFLFFNKKVYHKLSQHVHHSENYYLFIFTNISAWYIIQFQTWEYSPYLASVFEVAIFPNKYSVLS